jgi:heterodisulfide reductase subunit A-like polyferredoxin
MSQEQPKQAIVFCTCSGICPSMAKIDFMALAERVRVELGDDIEFMALHPRLCEADGERFMARVVNDTIQLVTPACAEKRQEKLLRDGFQKAGVPMDKAHWCPIAMAMETTDSVFEKIKAVVQARKAQQPKAEV